MVPACPRPATRRPGALPGRRARRACHGRLAGRDPVAWAPAARDPVAPDPAARLDLRASRVEYAARLGGGPRPWGGSGGGARPGDRWARRRTDRGNRPGEPGGLPAPGLPVLGLPVCPPSAAGVARGPGNRGAGRRGRPPIGDRGGRSTRLPPIRCLTSRDRAIPPAGARCWARDGRRPRTCHGRVRRHHVPPGHLLKTPSQTRPLCAALHPGKSLGRAECPVGAESILHLLPQSGLLPQYVMIPGSGRRNPANPPRAAREA